MPKYIENTCLREQGQQEGNTTTAIFSTHLSICPWKSIRIFGNVISLLTHPWKACRDATYIVEIRWFKIWAWCVTGGDIPGCSSSTGSGELTSDLSSNLSAKFTSSLPSALPSHSSRTVAISITEACMCDGASQPSKSSPMASQSSCGSDELAVILSGSSSGSSRLIKSWRSSYKGPQMTLRASGFESHTPVFDWWKQTAMRWVGVVSCLNALFLSHHIESWHAWQVHRAWCLPVPASQSDEMRLDSGYNTAQTGTYTMDYWRPDQTLR